MQAVAIGCVPLDLEISCFGSLSRFNRNDFGVYIIVISGKGWREVQKQAIINSSSKVGASVSFVDEFDYSAVTQENVRILRNTLEEKNTSIVFIPFTKATSNYRQIVGASGLLAARSIQNVLMYEPDIANRQFVPDVYIPVGDAMTIIESCLSGGAYTKSTERRKKDLRSRHRFYSKKINTVLPVEAFQSHRIVLNSDVFD